jgi:hypothetical protein
MQFIRKKGFYGNAIFTDVINSRTAPFVNVNFNKNLQQIDATF